MTGAPVIVIFGPTASGKSSLAIDVAREFDGVIVNADSMQVYQELRVLTARPTAEDEALAPHKLYGVLGAAEACSAGRWLELAVPEIEAAWGGQTSNRRRRHRALHPRPDGGAEPYPRRCR